LRVLRASGRSGEGTGWEREQAVISPHPAANGTGGGALDGAGHGGHEPKGVFRSIAGGGRGGPNRGRARPTVGCPPRPPQRPPPPPSLTAPPRATAPQQQQSGPPWLPPFLGGGQQQPQQPQQPAAAARPGTTFTAQQRAIVERASAYLSNVHVMSGDFNQRNP